MNNRILKYNQNKINDYFKFVREAYNIVVIPCKFTQMKSLEKIIAFIETGSAQAKIFKKTRVILHWFNLSNF